MRLIKYIPAYDEEIASLFHDTVHSVCAGEYSPAQLDAWAPDDINPSDWCESLGVTYALLAIDGGKLAGFGNADIRASYIDRLYVGRDYIGHGIGKLILKALENQLHGRVSVHASDTALPFFRAMGYAAVKENRVIRRGIVLRNWYMEKELP